MKGDPPGGCGRPKETERIADPLTGSVSVLKKVWKVEMELLAITDN